MKFGADRLKKLTLLSVAAYVFVLALAAKGVFLFGAQHPPKEELLFVQGIVRQVRLGGQGKSSTRLQIESNSGTHRYSSYFGKVWPGMKRIRSGDRVQVLAERNRLNGNELITGKQYYIWELVHHDRVVVTYDDVRRLVEGPEATANQYANGVLAASLVFLVIAYVRKVLVSSGTET